MLDKSPSPAKNSYTSRVMHVERNHFSLKVPFRISRGVKDTIEVINVKLEEGNHIGWSEGVPYLRFNETADSAIRAIESVRHVVEAGASRHELLNLLPPSAARNAIDCAMWDLEAKLSRNSVAQLAKLDNPTAVRTALTISLDTPAQMAQVAASLPRDALLKVKVDGNRPAEQLRAVRDAAPFAKLIVDPNESWNENQVRSMQSLLGKMKVVLLDQPIPAAEDDWLKDFTPLVPLCADEAVLTVDDVPHVAERYQMVNIKLDKAGGLTSALALARAAEAKGLKIMTGCMICSSLSIAPALHIAQLSTFVDLDGSLWLNNDWNNGISEKGGELLPPSAGFWGGYDAF